MKTKARDTSRNGLTKIELIVTLAIIVVLLGLTLHSFRPNHGRHHGHTRIRCVNNLKQIRLAFHIFAYDHNDLFPTQLADAQGGAMESAARGDVFRVFQVMSNELSVPKTVICPSDNRVAATNWTTFSNHNTSYFLGLDATTSRTNLILAGDRNLALNGRLLTGIAALGTNSPLTWTKEIHQEAGNIALSDGSVLLVKTAQLRQQLANTGGTTNRVVFPQ
jgi:competence protein ComGC